MKKNQPIPVVLLSVIIFLFVGCKSDSPLEVISLVSAYGQESGGISIGDHNVLVVDNRIGGIIINGRDSIDVIDYFLYKQVNAETIVGAQQQFGEIVLLSSTENDSLKCTISAPLNSERFEYYCSLSLDVPARLPCVIKSPNRAVSTAYLDTTLTVSGSEGDIEVARHSGSCDLETTEGDILVEMILPQSGFCRSLTMSGDITLGIPATTSANIFAKTGAGSITTTDLNLSDMLVTDSTLSAVLDSGLAEIRLETMNGNIQIIGF